MSGLFSGINGKTFVAVLVFIMVDKKFNLSGKVLSALGMGPSA